MAAVDKPRERAEHIDLCDVGGRPSMRPTYLGYPSSIEKWLFAAGAYRPRSTVHRPQIEYRSHDV